MKFTEITKLCDDCIKPGVVQWFLHKWNILVWWHGSILITSLVLRGWYMDICFTAWLVVEIVRAKYFWDTMDRNWVAKGIWVSVSIHLLSGNMNDSGTLIEPVCKFSKALLTQKLKHGTIDPNTQNISDCGKITC